MGIEGESAAKSRKTLVHMLRDALVCGEKALIRQKRFWAALFIVWFIAAWIWPFGWIRSKEQARIAQAGIPGFECNSRHQPKRVSAGFGRGRNPYPSGLETYPVTGTGDSILGDSSCLASIMKGMTYYKGKWVLDIYDSRTGETLFTIIKYPTPEGRPAHEGSVNKP